MMEAWMRGWLSIGGLVTAWLLIHHLYHASRPAGSEIDCSKHLGCSGGIGCGGAWERHSGRAGPDRSRCHDAVYSGLGGVRRGLDGDADEVMR
jgi:hypothetical protein